MPHNRGVGAALFVLLSFSASSAQPYTSPSVDDQAGVITRDPAIEHEVRALLEEDGYRFCQDKKYRLFQAEQDAVCHRLSAFEGRCPELQAACNRPPWEADMDIKAELSWFDWSFLNFTSGWLAAVFKLLFWISLGIGGALLVRALVRQARHWKQERDLEQTAVPAVLSTPEPGTGEELRAQVLFQMARSELDQNRITEGLHLTYRAVVRTLSDAEWVKPHRSKTSGDYLRNLRKLERTDLALPVQEVTSHLLDLDRERFGGRAESERARGLLEQATKLAARLVQVGAFALALSALGCDFRSIPESPTEPKAPRGLQLFEDLMRTRAGSVTRRLHRVTELPPETSAVVAVGAQLRKLEWETLRAWASSGGHLIVAGPRDEFAEVFGVNTHTQPCSAPLAAPELNLAQFGESAMLSGDTSGYVLATCGSQPFALSQDYQAGSLTIVADDRFFENMSLAASDNATLAFHFVGMLGGHVEFLGPWTGRGAFHPLESIARAGFGWWVFHVLLLGTVYALSRGKRFGPAVDPPEQRRRAFTEHARALSLKYEKSKASGWALRNYAEWVYENLRRRAPSTKADLISLSRAVSTSDLEAKKLRQALISARRADELGDTASEHKATFLRLKGAILGISEVSRPSTHQKD